MNDIRVKTSFILDLANQINSDEEVYRKYGVAPTDTWVFTTEGGNKLVVRRSLITSDYGEHDVLDFEYNPED